MCPPSSDTPASPCTPFPHGPPTPGMHVTQAHFEGTHSADTQLAIHSNILAPRKENDSNEPNLFHPWDFHKIKSFKVNYYSSIKQKVARNPTYLPVSFWYKKYQNLGSQSEASTGESSKLWQTRNLCRSSVLQIFNLCPGKPR